MCSKHAFTWCQGSEFQLSNFEVFPPKCEVLLLTGLCFQSTRREEIIKKASHFQVTCGIKWYNLPNIILFRKLGEDYASARAQFQISLNGATVVEVKPLLRDSEASINKCYPLLALRKSSMLFGLSIYIRRNFLWFSLDFLRELTVN